MSDSYLKMKTEQQFFFLVLVQSSSADKGCETNCLQRNTHKFAYFDTNDTIIPSREVSGPLNYRGGGGADQNPWLGKMMGKSTERKLEPFYIVVLSIVRNYKECMHELTKEK